MELREQRRAGMITCLQYPGMVQLVHKLKSFADAFLGETCGIDVTLPATEHGMYLLILHDKPNK